MVLSNIKNKYSLIILMGIFLIILSITIFLYNYIKYKKVSKNEQLKIEEFFNIDNSSNDNIINHQITNQIQEKQSSYNYIAILEIPSINLKKGLVEQNNKYNDVKYNIQIINSSTFPDVENGNLILASHNGANYISYFKNLSKMCIEDKIYIYYNGYRYEYILTKIYDVEKTGKIDIKRDYNKTTITLVTCKKNTNNKQVVYIGYLNNKIKY